jgi:lysozyme family protein
MADFARSLRKVLAWEGAYSRDPRDPGGETYRGISRRYHQEWRGWEIVDSAKHMAAFPAGLDHMAALSNLVEEFYRTRYWDGFCGDDLPSQKLADEMLDIGVHLGLGEAVKFVQRGVNLLNRNGRLYRDIAVDGCFGDETFAALAACVAQNPIRYLLTILNILQGQHYIDRMEDAPTQERWVGWLDRVELLHR